MTHFILLFLANCCNILFFGTILNLMGLPSDNIYSCVLMYIFFNLQQSIIALYFSKQNSLKSVNGTIINFPCNNIEKRLVEAVKQQSQLVGIKTPTIAVYSSPTMNAFATGFKKNNSLIAFSSSLLTTMNHEEIEAIIAHELTHITRRDVITMIVLQNIVNASIFFVSQVLFRYFLKFFPIYKKNYSVKKSILFAHLPIIHKYTINIISSAITMWFSRKREFYADAGAAKIVGCKKIIAALKRLKNSCNPQEPESIHTLCINGKYNKYISFFRSHPTLDQRIEAIKKRKYISSKV
ncbi:protease HtpX [Buchnera aphidicola]|uniref:protease HtpX n=1 Tax=Buchnera aphidicola TaxID=9 RepID=UPI00094C735E|nr:protease HtpX [Buchnera aphidicola]